jgi:hypothetical protein
MQVVLRFAPTSRSLRRIDSLVAPQAMPEIATQVTWAAL